MHRLFTRLAALLALATAVLGLSVAAQAKPVKPAKHVVITGGTATVTATTATGKFLAAHKVTVTTIAPASLSSGAITLPVAAGVLKDRTLHGVVLLRGGVKFATDKRTVVLRDLTVMRTSKTWLWGKVNGHLTKLARLTKLTRTLSGKTATVTGEIHLTAAAAKAIDRLFGTHAVKAGYDLGSFSATLNLK